VARGRKKGGLGKERRVRGGGVWGVTTGPAGRQAKGEKKEKKEKAKKGGGGGRVGEWGDGIEAGDGSR